MKGRNPKSKAKTGIFFWICNWSFVLVAAFLSSITLIATSYYKLEKKKENFIINIFDNKSLKPQIFTKKKERKSKLTR